MGRTAQSSKSKILITFAVLVILAVPIAIWQTTSNTKPNIPQTAKVTPVKQAEPSTQISYQGEDGKTALELLKTHADVKTTKDPSLGEYVTSVNGNDGGGKKYWLYFVDGKEAAEGAGTYVTKSSETIEWKLQ